MTGSPISWIIITIVLTAAGQLCLKKVADSPLSLTGNASLWLGLLLYGLSTVAYVKTLQQVRISVAFPVIIGGTSLLVVVLASIIVKESIGLFQIGGVIVIIAGIALLTAK